MKSNDIDVKYKYPEWLKNYKDIIKLNLNDIKMLAI
jgi:hypothetical protein